MTHEKATSESVETQNGVSTAELSKWLHGRLCDILDMDPGTLDLEADLVSHGLDSLDVEILLTDIEDYTKLTLAPDELFHCRSVSAIVEHLAGRLQRNSQ